eukprot:3037642-Rhodomonas_salina.1
MHSLRFYGLNALEVFGCYPGYTCSPRKFLQILAESMLWRTFGPLLKSRRDTQTLNVALPMDFQ